jgi:hypothetical protein
LNAPRTCIIFLFYKTPMLALGPTQLYIQGVQGSFLGVKQLEHDADHSPLSSVKVKNKWHCAYTLPVCLHGTQGQLCNFKLRVQLTSIKNMMLSSQSSVFLTDITLLTYSMEQSPS